MNDPSFNPNEILNSLLQAGREYVAKGQALAEDKLDIPESGEQREAMLDGLKKGAVASALLVGLLGTRGGRSLTGTVLKIGGLAALGTAAYKGYQNWKDTGDILTPVHELTPSASERRSLLLIQAMVAAANADGRIDDDEQLRIKHEILELHLPGELAMALENVIDSPLTGEELAQKVADKAEASEVYLAARLLIDRDSSPAEKLFLDNLVAALALPTELVTRLEAEAA